MGKISDYISNNRGYLRGHAFTQMAVHSPFGALILFTGGMPYVSLGAAGVSAGFLCYLSVGERKEKKKRLVNMALSEKLELRTNRDSLGYQILNQYLWLSDDPDFDDDVDFSARPMVEMSSLTKFQADLIDVFLLKAGEEDDRSSWLKDTMEASHRASYESFPELHEHAAGIAGAIGFMQGRGYLAA